jgi:glucose/mannose-6-phosphate isomerase
VSEDLRAVLTRMLGLVADLPAQLLGSAAMPGRDEVSGRSLPGRDVLLCGMGGSAVAGDLVQPLCTAAGVRLRVHRDYGLPGDLVPGTLVVLSSYSGDTEETLAALAEARERRLPLLGLTSGGALLAAARGTEGGPRFPVLVLPPGLPPRAALGHSLGALLWGLHEYDLLPSPAPELQEAAAVLKQRNAVLGPAAGPAGPAANLARTCRDRFVVVYTTSAESHGAGLRWKAQLNENAKSPAYAAPFPELNHNDIVGWELPAALRRAFVLVLLRSADEHPRVTARVAITRELLSGQFAAVQEVQARGSTPLARTLSLVQYGDYLSCYLAELRGLDPLPVTRIDVLKEHLQKGPQT